MARYAFFLLSILILSSGCRRYVDGCGLPRTEHGPVYLRVLDDAGNDILADNSIELVDIDVVKNSDPKSYEEMQIVSGKVNGIGDEIKLLRIETLNGTDYTIFWNDDAATNFNVDHEFKKEIKQTKCGSMTYVPYLLQDDARAEKRTDMNLKEGYVDYFVLRK